MGSHFSLLPYFQLAGEGIVLSKETTDLMLMITMCNGITCSYKQTHAETGKLKLRARTQHGHSILDGAALQCVRNSRKLPTTIHRAYRAFVIQGQCDIASSSALDMLAAVRQPSAEIINATEPVSC